MKYLVLSVLMMSVQAHGQDFVCQHSGLIDHEANTIDYTKGPSIFWKDRTVVLHPGIIYSDKLSDEFLMQAMRDAADVWNNVEGSDFTFIVDSKIDTDSFATFNVNNPNPQIAVNVITTKEEWTGSEHVIATTYDLSWPLDGQIFETGMALNVQNFTFKDCKLEKCGSGDIDLVTILVHELGHMAGLDHAKYQTEVMYPYISGVHRTLSASDKAGLVFLYPEGAESPNCYPEYERGTPRPESVPEVSKIGGCSQTNFSDPGNMFWLLGLLFATMFIGRGKITQRF